MAKPICYNCGIELKDKEITREHIPAKNLFEGYDEKYKVNRITVPSCIKCNGQYSPTDEEFRNLIGSIAKIKENNKITEKSVRSFLRKEEFRQRLETNPLGIVSSISFNKTTIENFHKKNFKGLFYHQYGKIISNDYELFVNIDENNKSEITQGILGYLKGLFNWKHSGHKDIMQYIIQPFRLGITNERKIDLIPTENENIFVGVLIYNNEHAALVIAIREINNQ